MYDSKDIFVTLTIISGVLFVPKGIIHPVVSVSALMVYAVKILFIIGIYSF